MRVQDPNHYTILPILINYVLLNYIHWIELDFAFQPLGFTGQYLCLHQVLKFGYGQINTKSSSIVQLTLRQTRQGEEGRGILERAVWVKGRLCMAASIKHCGDRERLLHMIRLDTFDCLGPIQLTISLFINNIKLGYSRAASAVSGVLSVISSFQTYVTPC